MTIRQQGGIFGRNPKFNDVEANDVTATDVSASTGSFSTSLSSGGVSASSYASTASDFVTGGTSGQSGMTLVGDPASQTNIFFADGTSGGAVAAGYIIYSHAGGSMLVGVENNTAFTVNSSGNLAFPSGQGIDFSATSGTGTSELFDDYEEGTWTPAALDSAGHNFTASSAVGLYVKTGSLVTASCSFSWSSIGSVDASPMIIAGLPFTSNSTSGANNSGSIGYMSGFDTTDKMLTINLGPNLSYAKLYRINDNAAPTDLPANAQSASGQINFTISYMT